MTTAYVINLDSRTDRWEQVQKDWKNAFPLVRVPAVLATPGWKGCSLSQIKIVEEARARGESYVLVWEDDCMPRNRHPFAIRALWFEIMAKLNANQDKWDIVLGGATWAQGTTVSINNDLSTYNATVYNLPRGFCAHWALWNVNTTYDKLMEYKTTLESQIDVYMYNHFRVKVVVPFLAEQRQGYSNIENADVNYADWFNSSESRYIEKFSLKTILQKMPVPRTPTTF